MRARSSAREAVSASTLAAGTVTDFGHKDQIEFDGGVSAGFGQVQAAMQQVGDATVIALDAEHVIELDHVSMSSLHASDFMFV